MFGLASFRVLVLQGIVGSMPWNALSFMFFAQSKGLFEKERTDDFILCESRHLSTFGVSGDDVVPEFNMVNPIADADLFTNINLDNSLAIFILGFIYAAFALANLLPSRARRAEKLASL